MVSVPGISKGRRALCVRRGAGQSDRGVSHMSDRGVSHMVRRGAGQRCLSRGAGQATGAAGVRAFV